MSTDEIALRFRQWADSELAYLDRTIESMPELRERLGAERAMLRRTVAWIESAAGVPTGERLIDGGTRRLRSWEDRTIGQQLHDARIAAWSADPDAAGA